MTKPPAPRPLTYRYGLAIVTVVLAWRNRLTKHVAIARWTLPIWMYVSLTGILVYLMLYRMA